MKAIIIYGPPGVGKLTVAKELARQTGFKLLHNHLATDMIAAVVPFGSKGFFSLAKQIRLLVLSIAERNKVSGVILTGVYSPKEEIDLTDRFIAEVARIVKGRIFLVKLICTGNELFKRVKLPSRRRFKKLHEVSMLHSLLGKYELYATARVGKSLVVDNTKLSAKRCARKIAAYYKL